ncbi:hypothetical protein BC939DRAFT_151939 [Gamsiella multidivaricata]|uniref:uncharacterized protein n=1 Tax=Gamsiella multidivaricata TaxID=101098 RepID=UPI00221E3E0C|nr:uncharacterized protein BC939DRAFT_151939 [Gamsiella multidivaricata]KAI7824052.1 hypothetical protein BC939DRAFT_151939 [Gamsiella multidivaricata]
MMRVGLKVMYPRRHPWLVTLGILFLITHPFILAIAFSMSPSTVYFFLNSTVSAILDDGISSQSPLSYDARWTQGNECYSR